MKGMKPCPFCGSGDIHYRVLGLYQEVACLNCGFKRSGPDDVRSPDNVIPVWEFRPIEDALRAENARLAAENEALNALVEALSQKCNALLYPGSTDVAGHLEVAAATQAVDAARARLEEVRNAKA